MSLADFADAPLRSTTALLGRVAVYLREATGKDDNYTIPLRVMVGLAVKFVPIFMRGERTMADKACVDFCMIAMSVCAAELRTTENRPVLA